MNIPEPEHGTSAAIFRHYESKTNSFRAHLGCSVAGHHCDRWIWFSFRWAVKPYFDGRTLRLFQRGQLEEMVVVADLRAIGCTVTHTGADQSRVTIGPHVGGSIDGIVEAGLPESPKKRHILEIKTHNAKSFTELEQRGVAAAKPMHYAQMQLYMLGSGIDRALYFSVCKNDDRIYTERVKYDKEFAEKLAQKAAAIAISDRCPEPISADPGWWQCGFCDGHDLCHGSKITKEVNCRTCAHSTATSDGDWYCARHDASGIPYDFQAQGCDCHVLHPDLVPWPMQGTSSGHDAIYIIDGKLVRNGEPDGHVFSSREILDDPSACASFNGGDRYA